ncbi:hypothetical protein QUA27_25035 [Microcoleus sp. Pol14C6]
MSASDGYGKAAITRTARPYTSATHHHLHRIFGAVGNTRDPFRNARAVQV